jgi:serine/threonine-protein kinase
MADVFKASDTNLPRVVAVKIIHSHLSRDPEFVRRFRSEATVLARLRHPNIVQVYDLNHDDKAYFIVLEFVPGETLQARLKRLAETERKMEIDDVLKTAINIGEALQYAHERDIVHRDVKPANVMLDIHGNAILMDFGIVKIVGGTQHTATGAVLGTARYMSPEQIKGQRVGAGTDIYSFGVMLYEMVGGRPPFNSDSAMTLMMMHINEPVPDVNNVRRGTPPGLSHIINKAMSKEVDRRYSSMAELLVDLRRVQAGAAPAMTAPPAAAKTEPPQRQVNLTELIESEMDSTDALTAPRRQPARTPAQRQQPRPAQAHPQPVPPLPGATVGQNTTQRTYIIGTVLAVVAVLVGIYLIFFTGGGDGEEQETQTPISVAGGSSPEATPVTGETPPEEATPVAVEDTPEAEATEEVLPTATDLPPPTATDVPPPTATDVPPPTATDVPPPTATSPPPPTATSPPAAPYSVSITSISIDANNRYVVSYETFGYTESVPGMHVHFFFDTVAPEQAGVPGSGPWILYGGPRPFTGYGVGDRPGGANNMCALVANPDHSVVANSGNCWGLP